VTSIWACLFEGYVLDWDRGKPVPVQHYCKQFWVYVPRSLAWRGEAKASDCIPAILQTGTSFAHHDEVMWFFSRCTSCLLLSMDVWCRSSDVCKWVGGDPLLLWESDCHQSPYGSQFSFVARKTIRIFLVMFLWSFLNYRQEFFAKLDMTACQRAFNNLGEL